MNDNEEELSVGEILSSIKMAVLDTKSPLADSKITHVKNSDAFILTADMLYTPSKNKISNGFSKASETLLSKYAKVFVAWQSLIQHNKRVSVKDGLK